LYPLYRWPKDVLASDEGDSVDKSRLSITGFRDFTDFRFAVIDQDIQSGTF
jgi:hypothetical protein